MAEQDVAGELEERLNGGETPDDEPAEDPDLEDESPDDEDKPDDEEPGPDDVGEPEPDPEPVRTKKQSAQDRVQNALRERDDARRAVEQANRERDEARAQRQRDEAATEAQRERELLDGLDENGRTQYVLAKELKKTQDGQSRLERQIADSSDRAAFATKAAKDPRRARLLDEVERIYQQHRPNAPDLQRDTVYYLLLGRKLEEGTLSAAPGKQRKAAAGRVAAQRTNGGRPRSDAQPRQRGRGDLASRMEADDPAI